MFVEIEDAIVARLQARIDAATLPAKPRIYTAASAADLRDKSQGDALIFLVYTGINRVNPLSGNPAFVTITQGFTAWVVTRSANRHGSQAGTRELADPIMVEIMTALCGWRYAAGKSPIELTESQGPEFDEGFGYFPLSFQVSQQIRGAA